MKKRLLRAAALVLIVFSPVCLGAAEGLGLKELIELAYQQNLDVKISDKEIELSRIDEKTADNALIPNLDLSVSRGFNKYYDSYQRGLNMAENNWTYSLKLSQTYKGLGKIPAIAADMAKLRTEIQKTYYENSKLSVLRELTGIFFQLIRDQELAKIHKADLVLIEELLRIAKVNEEVGLVLHNDVLRIETEQLSRKSDLIKTENNFMNRKIDLFVLLNLRMPDTLELKLPAGLKFEHYSFKHDPVYLEALLNNDYDIALKNKDIELLKKLTLSAKKASLPDLTVSANYKYGNKYGTGAAGKDNKDLSATFELTLPVYDSGDISNAIKSAVKSEEIAAIELENLKTGKITELGQALNDYNEAVLRIDMADKMIEQSLNNMQIIFTRYQEGAADIVEVIDAVRLLTDSAETAVESYYDERAALLDIYVLTHKFDEIYLMDQNSLPLKTSRIMDLIETRKTEVLGDSK